MKKLNEDFFKIHFVPEETKITQEGNKVFATLYGYVSTPHWGEFLDDESSSYQDVAMLPFMIHETGVAELMDGDEFSFEIGKKIALAKAENKCYSKVMRMLGKRVEELNAFVEAVDNFSEKVVKVVDHNIDYIKRVGK